MARNTKGRKVSGGDSGLAQLVANQNKHHAAAPDYYHFRLRFKGGDIRDILMTPHEMKRGLERVKKNPEDLPEVPRLQEFVELLVY